ncbi:DNA replication complex GINS protein PSF3 isoform X2 [Aphelocoma coerulescens]|uniref:DNA replication complex GINS protein PSF3 isoform X2 n=1 Tax=Aphelocoma coerulescens TaxID=39617 RepID=UPI003604A23A
MSDSYFPVGPGLGMEENFLSLDDILMSQEKLPGRAESALPRLAVLLGQGAGSAESVPEGSKLEIPLWLAKGLHDSKRRIISVELPKIYKEAWRTVFSADANVVDLHKMGPYYYGFGSQLLNFENPENPEIAQTILQELWMMAVSPDHLWVVLLNLPRMPHDRYPSAAFPACARPGILP